MKTSNANQPGEGSHAVVRGHTGTLRAGSSGIDFTNADATTVDGVTSITLSGLSGNDLTDGALQLVAELGVASLTAITPAQLVANTDNWAPVDAGTSEPLDTATIVRASTNASRNLTGIVAPDPASERLVILENIGAFDLVLKHNVTSTAANRFYCPNDTDLTLQKDSAVVLEYDLTSARWRVVGGTGSSSGVYELATEGGQSVIKAHGSMGATETFDPTDGNVHTGTLDANCTFTLNAPAGTGAATLELYLTQDGTGSRTVTWPGSVVWSGGTAPTLATAAGSIDRIILETLDGGTTWYGTAVGSGSSLTVKDEGGALATAATSLDFVGAGVVASGTGAAKTITISGAPTGAAGGDLSGTYPNPTIVPAVITALLPPAHVHVDNVTFSGDAIATVWELPAAPVDAYSVAAYVDGVRVDMTLSGALLTTMTFGTAPGTGTGNIRVDIGAALA